MKRLISIILMIALSLGVTACDRSSANNYSQYREDGRLILTIWAPISMRASKSNSSSRAGSINSTKRRN